MSLIKTLINPKTENYYRLKEYVLSHNMEWHWNDASIKSIYAYRNRFSECGIPVEEIDNYINAGFYGHTVITRNTIYDKDNPHLTDDDPLLPVVVSDLYRDLVNPFLCDLIRANVGRDEGYIRSILRCNFNAVHSDQQGFSIPHEDHDSTIIPHKNMLVYLTDSGGKTFVGTEYHSPAEDDIVVFNSSKLHYMEMPKSKRRIVMVMTFI
jgi:hypothetical protein